MHTYIHTYMHTYIHTYIHTYYIHTCIHTYTCTFVWYKYTLYYNAGICLIQHQSNLNGRDIPRLKILRRLTRVSDDRKSVSITLVYQAPLRVPPTVRWLRHDPAYTTDGAEMLNTIPLTCKNTCIYMFVCRCVYVQVCV